MLYADVRGKVRIRRPTEIGWLTITRGETGGNFQDLQFFYLLLSRNFVALSGIFQWSSAGRLPLVV